jgi:hypothetical protein
MLPLPQIKVWFAKYGASRVQKNIFFNHRTVPTCSKNIVFNESNICAQLVATLNANR